MVGALMNGGHRMRLSTLALCVVALLCGCHAPRPMPYAATTKGPEIPVIGEVEFQPLVAATRRLVEALDYLGAPIPPAEREALHRAFVSDEPQEAARRIQELLDPLCLAHVNINPESRVKVREGPAPKRLVQRGWRTFLVKVHNEAGVTAVLKAESDAAAPLFKPSTGSSEPEVSVPESEIPHRFLELVMANGPPLKERLSGLLLEYRILQVSSRDAGPREASVSFHVGQGTQDIGFRNEVPLLFHCEPAVEVTLSVTDVDGRPTTAAFEFRDQRGLIYPSPGRRLAPDFFFHAQVYRKSGESVLLPPGVYDVVVSRGPEYRRQRRKITVPEARTHQESFALERWIHLAKEGWISGDHHIHAAGCSHYESPAQGVLPEDMMRHILGEDLNVGCVLSWGPCWYYQKQFFDGENHPLSTDETILRYDVEVSGFPSSHAGHLSLFRLTEDDYADAERIEDWPSWDLPVLQWAKEQDGIAGFSHSGWGLAVPGPDLPNFHIPPFDGIGANEYIVDVTHDSVDFISMVDTPSVWELNIWYQTLNCGYRTRISGETDFPCIYGERVGLGRSYVKMPPGAIDYDRWAEGIRDGRAYVTDGQSHLIDFTVGKVAMGEPGSDGVISQLDLDGPHLVSATARVAALLPEQPRSWIRDAPLDHQPYWHLERARIGDGRTVPVELIVNGTAVERREILADGTVHDVRFETRIDRSAWVAMRILPSSHTNPVFVIVDGKPVRADRRSAEWCLKSVDRCWESKLPGIREEEREAAEQAYEHAREAYRRVLEECE